MQQTITIKVRIKPESKSDIQALESSMERYRQGCDEVSRYIFDHDFEMSQTELNQSLYQQLRTRYHLKSQMAQSAIRTVVASYRTLRTQMKQHPYRYSIKTEAGYTKYSVPRNLYWLWEPVGFKRPQLDLQRKRDWSISKDGTLSINTIYGRIHVPFVCRGFDKYMDGTWQFGTAKIRCRKNKWYMYISASKNLPDIAKEQIKHVVGIDRGLRFLATAYDEQGKTMFFDGKQAIRKRRKFKRLRQQLQSRNTKSAKRRLKKVGQRENRYMTDINHCLSKTLADHFGPNTLFVLEDLTDVRSATEKVAKDQRYEQVSWAFSQLEQFLAYKAHLAGSEVIHVSAKYTSQRCPKCGRIRKANRDHHKHLYTCDRCGYASNDDRIGAMNIWQLGMEYINGDDHPTFIKQSL